MKTNKTNWIKYPLLAVAIFLLSNSAVFAQERNTNLAIEPEEVTLKTSVGSAQFQAFYNGEDLTEEVTWYTGLNSLYALDMGDPGEFLASSGSGTHGITAKYQDPETGEWYLADAQVSIVDDIERSAPSWHDIVSTSRLLAVGEIVEYDLYEVTAKGDGSQYNIPHYVRNISDEPSVEWGISDSSVLEMEEPGVFKAVGLGEASVEAIYKGIDRATHDSKVVVVKKENRKSYDVELVQVDPIFSAAEEEADHHQNNDFFGGILSLQGSNGNNYFVAAGYCSMVQGKTSDWFGSGKNQWGKKGLYLFSDNGEHIDTRDGCLDVMISPPRVCKHDNGCHGYFEMIDLGNGYFAREVGYDDSKGRPVATYKVGSSGMELMGKNFTGLRTGIGSVPTPEGEPSGTGDIAIANNVLVSLETVNEGKQRVTERGLPSTGDIRKRSGTTNTLYNLPNLTELGEVRVDGPFHCNSVACSGIPVLYRSKFVPVVGVGEYFIASEDNPRRTSDMWVYRMPSTSEILNGKKPEKIQNLKNDLGLDGLLKDYTIDVLNSNRIILVVGEKLSSGGRAKIYTAGENGLELEDEFELTGKYNHHLLTYYANRKLSLMGDYVAYSKCEPGEKDCDLVVMKNGNKLSVEDLPLGPYAGEQSIQGLEISPSGRIMVGTKDYRAGGMTGTTLRPGYGDYLYLYQIKDFEGADPVKPTDPSDLTPQTQTPTQPQQVDINAIMRQYGITPLRDYNFQDTATNYTQSFSNTFFNSNQPTDNVEQRTENYTLSRPPQTIAEIRAFQCAYNIVCEGSISTTGYGNLGPKTQAKINEVFGQDGSVNGTHTTIQTSGMTIQEMQELINQLLQQVAELQAQIES